jgi:hypothetical protein
LSEIAGQPGNAGAVQIEAAADALKALDVSVGDRKR